MQDAGVGYGDYTEQLTYPLFSSGQIAINSETGALDTGDIKKVYASYFEKDFPAREAVAVKTLPKNVNVEISVVAMRE